MATPLDAIFSKGQAVDKTEPPAALATKIADQKVTPWDVEGATVDGKQVGIDYDKLIQQFGTKKIDDEMLQRFEKLTGHKAHPFLRRGLFFSHRYVLKPRQSNADR